MTALWRGRCPRCAKGQVFKHPISRLLHFTEMNNTCSVCGASFEPEPGFYFGAMFISYAFAVAIMFVNSVILYVFFNPETVTYIYVFLASVLLATPVTFRYSRLIWLYWFGGHRRQ